MKLYSVLDKKLKQIPSINFKLEKEIQSLVELNLLNLFNLKLVKSEVTIKNFRIDTLGFDVENKSFVIIEYKKVRNFSIIDQGYAYMSLLLNHKSDFVLEYNENCGGSLKRDDVDWSQSKIIFISPNFTEYQKHSINFKNVPFELWEILKYENNIIGFVHHKTTSEVSISTLGSHEANDVIKNVSKEIKIYTEEGHINQPKVVEATKELYYKLKERILNIGPDVEVKPRSACIGFKKGVNFFDVNFLKNGLWCWINLKKGELDDPKKLCRDVSNIGHYGNGDYDLKIFPETDLDYIMFLINQSYKKKRR
jgi:predicted transport protein